MHMREKIMAYMTERGYAFNPSSHTTCRDCALRTGPKHGCVDHPLHIEVARWTHIESWCSMEIRDPLFGCWRRHHTPFPE